MVLTRLGRRKSRQQVIKEKSVDETTSNVFRRRSSRLKAVSKDANLGIVNEDDDSDDDIQVVDESEYLRRLAALEINSIVQNVPVEGNEDLGNDNCKQCDIAEGMVDRGNDEDCNDVVKVEMNDDFDDNDDDIQVVDESEYLRRLAALEINSVVQNVPVKGNEDLGNDNCKQCDIVEGMVDRGNDEDCNDVVKVEMNDDFDDNDDDIQVVDESEYLRRLAARKINSVVQNVPVEDLGDDNCKKCNGDEDMVDRGNDEDCNNVVKAEMNDDFDDNDDIQVVDESEYHRRFAALKINSVVQNVPVESENNLGKQCNGDEDILDDMPDCGNDEDCNNVVKVGMNDESSDSSLQFIDERRNLDFGSESHSPVTSSDMDGETGDIKDDVGCSSKIVEVSSRLSDVVSEVNVCVGDSDGTNRSKSKRGRKKKRMSRVSSDGMFGKRRFDGLVLPVEPENNALEHDFVGSRTRSHRFSMLPRSKTRDGTIKRPILLDNDDEDDSPSLNGDEDDDREGVKNYVSGNATAAGKRGRGRPRKINLVKTEPELEPDPEPEPEPEPEPVTVTEIDSEPEPEPEPEAATPVKIDSKPQNSPQLGNAEGCENVVKRKRGRPPKNKKADTECRPPKKKQKLTMTNEAENIILDTILENGNNGGLEMTPRSETYLPLKFNFRVENSLPEKTEEEEEVEGLFDCLDFALRACDVGCSTSCSDEDEEDDDVLSYHGAVIQKKLCCEGKHFLILDDEVGIKCKYCSYVKLEIRNVTPAFEDEPFGRSAIKKSNWLYYDEYLAAVSNGLHIPEFNDNYAENALHSDNVQGTVWDLVPGIKKSLYPHQQEAFEFIWKNVGGSTKLDELGKSTGFRIGGCIICHAPGTGKTRLAITFLKSFLNKYPMSKPVIISPRSMLLTWEEEFARWNIDVPFHNMNKTELSGREDKEVLKYTARNPWTIRKAKLCSWAMGNSILGISYRLFEELAGDRKGMDKSIKHALLEQPGILVLDEGHTPRNDDSNIWNVLNKVKTKKRIILSGTPFQNNFEELHNTLSLVREEFRNPRLLGGYLDSDRRIMELKKWMKPFVHVHKGEILKKTLRGLFHSVLFLKPSDLQKTCCQHLAGVKYVVEQNHLVSVACVHPSLLTSCNQVPRDIDKVELEKHKDDVEVGLKIRFLFELIKLVVGEKILVFSQYLPPLKFIARLLTSRYRWTEGKEFLCMHGQQDTKQRQSFINTFNNPSSEVRVLLASTKACGEGIHLVGASRVVLLDVVWNPSVERQAISRAYRIGQKKDVFVYHLILSGTLEEKKYYRLVNKDRLSELVFSSEGESKEKLSVGVQVSEDRVLEEMIDNEKTSRMFVKIIRESKVDELIKSFNPVNP